MWERFTERARRVVYYAQREAERHGHDHISTEHMLLGLVTNDDSVANRILEKLGVTSQQVRAAIESDLQPADRKPSSNMQLTPRCKRVIDLAYDEAKQLGNNYIGTEHLLLGLIRESEGLAGRILAMLRVDLEAARNAAKTLQLRSPAPAPVQSSAKPEQAPAASTSPFSAAAREVLERARTEAVAANSAEVSTGHLLLALAQTGDSLAGSILADAGITVDQLWQRLSGRRSE
jgi:ATP-dependent Clp protease ATP-binding subunit ClpC